MIRKVVLHNFMSHGSTVIEPACGIQLRANGDIENNHDLSANDVSGANVSGANVSGANVSGGGLTVLVGENNSGKSAIVTALQVISQNASGDFMVRHGENDCSITVETLEPATGEVNEIIWRRQKGKVSYSINGREIDRLKGGIPGDLHDHLRLAKVETSRDQFDLHIGEQKRPIFLLGDKSSDRAAFFASSSDTCKLIEMQELHRSRIKQAKSDRKQKRQLQEQLESRLESLKPLDTIGQAIESLENRRADLETRLQNARQLKSLCENITAHSRQAESCRARLKILEATQPVPALQPTEELADRLRRLRSSRRQLNELSQRAEVLSECTEPPELAAVDGLHRLLDRLAFLQPSIGKLNAQQEILAGIKPPPPFHSAEQLAEQNRIACGRLAAARSERDQLERESRKLEKQLSRLNDQICDHFESMDQCPTCGQQVDLEIAVRKSGLPAESFAARLGSDRPASARSKPADRVSETSSSRLLGPGHDQLPGRIRKRNAVDSTGQVKQQNRKAARISLTDNRQQMLPLDLNDVDVSPTDSDEIVSHDQSGEQA